MASRTTSESFQKSSKQNVALKKSHVRPSCSTSCVSQSGCQSQRRYPERSSLKCMPVPILSRTLQSFCEISAEMESRGPWDGRTENSRIFYATQLLYLMLSQVTYGHYSHDL